MDIQEKIKELENELNILKTQISSQNAVQKWEPKGGDYYINPNMSVIHCESGERSRQYGIEFETREAAEKAAKVYRTYHRLYKLAEELNEGWEPDWSDNECLKYYIFSYIGGRMKTDWTSCNYLPTTIYFKDEKTAKKAIAIIETGGIG